jgi:hypothetical protein
MLSYSDLFIKNIIKIITYEFLLGINVMEGFTAKGNGEQKMLTVNSAG